MKYQINNMQVIALTGTPGAGKTYFAHLIKRKIKNIKIIEINKIINKYKLYSHTDTDNAKVADIKKLNKKLDSCLKNINEKNKNSNNKFKIKAVVVVGHLNPELNISFDVSFTIRTSLKTLEKRLKKRNYKKDKIKENLLAEALDYCGIKINKISKESYEIETKNEKQIALNFIKNLLNNGQKQKVKKIHFRTNINKMPDLLDFIKNGNAYKF
ncbi:MAG: AAA family ATPase [Candidatus Micrarchaeaceae archaeon]